MKIISLFMFLPLVLGKVNWHLHPDVASVRPDFVEALNSVKGTIGSNLRTKLHSMWIDYIPKAQLEDAVNCPRRVYNLIVNVFNCTNVAEEFGNLIDVLDYIWVGFFLEPRDGLLAGNCSVFPSRLEETCKRFSARGVDVDIEEHMIHLLTKCYMQQRNRYDDLSSR